MKIHCGFLEVFGATLLYALLGALGVALAISPGYSSPLFPAAGFALAWTMRRGWRALPSVALGSLALNLGISVLKGHPLMAVLPMAAIIGLGAALQSAVGAHWVSKYLKQDWQAFDNEKITLLMLTLGGVLPCVINATVGATSLLAFGVIEPGAWGFTWWTWYAGDVLGVLLVAPFFLLCMSGTQGRDWRRIRAVGAPLTLAVALATGIFLAASEWEARKVQDALNAQGKQIEDQLRARVIAHSEMLVSLARLMEVNDQLGPADFDRFTRATLKRQNDVFALSYNPVVRQADRPRFEQRQGALLNMAQFAVTERGPEGQLQPAQAQALHVPVAYISPMDGNKMALGFDIFSEPLRRQAIEYSMQTGKAAATAPLRLVQEQRPRPGVLLMEPLLNAHNEVHAFAVAVLKLDELIDLALLPNLAPGLQLQLADWGASERQVFYQTLGFDENNTLGDFDWRSTVEVANRQWTLHIVPDLAFIQAQRTPVAWAVGAAALFFAALLQVMIMAITGRTQLIKRQVALQTQFIESQNQQLEQAMAQAQDASQAKSRFLATMSHELRTPLNAMLGLARLLEMDTQSDVDRERARVILKSGELLLALLNDVLDLSKIEAGKFKLQQSVFELSSFMHDIEQSYQAMAQAKGLDWQVSIQGPSPLHIEADELRLRQVLINLVSNAIKFTEQGKVTLCVTVKPRASAPHRMDLRFEVQDTGQGIALALKDKLFKPFSQLDNSYARAHGGTGLGLSIVKNLVELMGGAVGVESSPGQGSVFWVELTVATAHNPALLSPAPSSVHTTADKAKLSGFSGRVLLVEDDAVNRLVAESLLKRLGLEVHSVDNGQEAVDEICAGQQYALVLMDLHMPGMDGREATTAIRQWERQQGCTPHAIVALTASAFSEEHERCMQAGMDGFLTKPIDLNALRAVLQQHCAPGAVPPLV